MKKIWISLLLLTLFSFALGYVQISSYILVVLLLGSTLIKGQLIIDYFMDLKEVRFAYRLVPMVWLVFVLAMIALAYFLPKHDTWQHLEVTATAYTSSKVETDDTPNIAAWGDKLKKGMKCIAVSRDLIKMGLGHGVKVRIDGFEGEYLVLDKMNKRWKKKIDIYMGKDRKKALQWGKKKVIIHWEKVN